MLIVPVPQREFELYALSLPYGPNFDSFSVHSAWKSDKSVSVGAVLHSPVEGFGILVMRRRTDHRLVMTGRSAGFQSAETARKELTAAMRPEAPPEPLPPGIRKRQPLLETKGRNAGEYFKILTGTATHIPALMAVGEVYLAMPRPDDNFVSDLQTSNFDSRLWELYLLAAFREQGAAVTQDEPSPDFLIERAGHRSYVEAVTANPRDGRLQGFMPPVFAPDDREERLLGPPAVRFAKTLHSKLQRRYEDDPRVRSASFMLAIADFHASGSMVWSREALPSYLYGIHAHVADGPDGPKAVGTRVSTLRGEEGIPSGLFRDPAMSHLSAVIFSNAATLGKFNRMGYLAGFRPKGLRMTRDGILFDRRPGALEPIPFKLDVLSDEYGAMWPGGEAWCQELEVFHNPSAAHPVNFDLLPGATHWYEQDGEILCTSMWEWSVLSSVTHLKMEN